MTADNKCPSRGNRYNSNEERYEARLSSKRQYASKSWTCETCNKTIQLGNRLRHLTSKMH